MDDCRSSYDYVGFDSVEGIDAVANIRIIRIRAASAYNTRELAGELGGLQSET